MTLEINDNELDALKVIVVFCLCNLSGKFYNNAELLLKWLQRNNVMQ